MIKTNLSEKDYSPSLAIREKPIIRRAIFGDNELTLTFIFTGLLGPA